jgi:isopenicillin N synthase-like dioxygenase
MNYPMRDKAAHFKRPLGPDQNTANIPIIDISAPNADQKEVAKQLVDAAEEHGFIYIRNLGHDIQAKDIDGAFDLVSKKKQICLN